MATAPCKGPVYIDLQHHSLRDLEIQVYLVDYNGLVGNNERSHETPSASSVSTDTVSLYAFTQMLQKYALLVTAVLAPRLFFEMRRATKYMCRLVYMLQPIGKTSASALWALTNSARNSHRDTIFHVLSFFPHVLQG